MIAGMETTQSVEDGIPTRSVGTSQSIAIINTLRPDSLVDQLHQ